jgi:hypothetical protein
MTNEIDETCYASRSSENLSKDLKNCSNACFEDALLGAVLLSQSIIWP